MDKIVKRALENYATSKKTELPPRIKRLIALATWNLYNGPSMEGQDDDEDSDDGSKVKWPGFSEACREIADATSDIVQDVWVDIQSENVQTSEPEAEIDGEEVFEVCWEDWAMVEARQLKAVLFGSELAQHI